MYPMPNQVPKKKPENDDCEIRVKRDSTGRVVGMKSKGKCTKEDKAIFMEDHQVQE